GAGSVHSSCIQGLQHWSSDSAHGGTQSDGPGHVEPRLDPAGGEDGVEPQIRDLQDAGGSGDPPVPEHLTEGAPALVCTLSFDRYPRRSAGCGDVHVANARLAQLAPHGTRQATTGLLGDDRNGQMSRRAPQRLGAVSEVSISVVLNQLHGWIEVDA